MSLVNRSTVALYAFSALATAIAVTAPQANAASVSGISVEPGLSFGSSAAYGTGCSYTLTVHAEPGTQLRFRDIWPDHESWRNTSPDYATAGTDGKASVTWTPSGTGEHTLVAYNQNAPENRAQTSATVGTGTRLGPICLVR
ncbi:hypothetical protein IU474_07210 [Nocardia otitidiscaviarum]|uniref:hypothetical protein n=1 Tax=Nocardia otitidiscaviarum TaxID=1823 RepID=UPI001E34C314|nr:hypothetical protein [Nocardia otitidiscaviarum]MBF6236866.1 hypothetical protein [Nocardia otitidiscaviarum]